jgi:hypothetical protein
MSEDQINLEELSQMKLKFDVSRPSLSALSVTPC